MKSTTAKFKQIMSSGSARNYLIKVDLDLADGTPLHLTEADIWEDSFSISTASSGTSSFDIGTAVIGKCTFTINNINGTFDSYDFFNASASVWLGLEGDASGSPAVQQYYRMGFFTVDEPQKANGLISLELLDNMWKFDVPFSNLTISYPITAVNLVNTICTYCGVLLAGTSQQFHGYNFSIAQAPEDKDNMNCREVLQYIAMIGCNFCTINDEGKLVIKWYDLTATSSTTDVFEFNKSTSFGTDEIEITGVKFVIDDTAYTVGTSGYVLELENPLVNATNVNTVLNLIWDVLDGFTLQTFNITTASDLAAEIGDKCKIRDYKGGYVYSWITTNSFKFAGHQLQCNAESPNRTLVTRYSKQVQAAVEVARKQTSEQISNYDLAVQMMNNLAVNAMGGYADYEDRATGGRYYFLSNMPITKSAQGTCSFEPGSVVYKVSGDGFFVSRDGGQTWVNGYSSQTGELVVNVLDAIGINFDWARGGTLTLGGYGNGNGELSILNSSNVEKIHGDNTGIKVGGTTGSKIFETVNGELQYFYDNTYQGKIKMDAYNYGTEEDPDYVDSLEIDEFDSIRLNTADDKATINVFQRDNGGSTEGVVDIYADDSIGLHCSAINLGENHLGQDPDIINANGTLKINGDIKPDVSSTGQTGNTISIDASGYTYQLDYVKGIVTGKTALSVPIPACWHRWEESGVTYGSIELAVGTTTATFGGINSAYNYEPYITCADNVEPPLLEGIKFNGTNCIVRFTAVTAAQVGTPTSPATSECVIKLKVMS